MAEAAFLREEGFSHLNSCMQSHGWDVSIDSRTGDIDADFDRWSEATWDLWNADFEVCSLSGPQGWGEGMTRTEVAHRFFERQVEQRDCLVHHGFQISYPPSLESFVDAWLSGSGGAADWIPIGEVPGPQSNIDRAVELCPCC
jgi:hypothetical protein